MLSAAHQKFAERIAAGDSKAKAYLAAFPNASKAVASAAGTRLFKSVKVIAEVKRLRAKVHEKGLFLEIEEKRRFLADIVRTAPGDIDRFSPLCQGYKWTEDGIEIKMPDKIRSLLADNDLAGDGAEAGANIGLKTFADKMAHIRSHKKQPA